ncbi:MAG TPA: hypothetical protein VIB99_10030 [Candidatus Limnocylindrales bacterium]
MSIQFEAYTAEGIRHGMIAADERLGDVLASVTELPVEGGRFSRLDGHVSAIVGTTRQPVDDFLVVVAPPELNGPAHSVWHDVRIHAGPYVLEARLPTLPGFDPARALARPSGSFVLLGEVHIGLGGRLDDGVDIHPLAWVNRYAVDRIESDLELGFFFPGAFSKVIHGFNTNLEPGDAPAAEAGPAERETADSEPLELQPVEARSD